ncbi:MAG: acyl-CoA dehydrogenase [Dehalococcoidia bacterium]|nr:acyl-CoA dehydrogenase [Dehalococcoidia bacterium]
MEFNLSETQQLLLNSARSFLEQECPSTFVRAMEEDERGFTPELWERLAEMGWLGLAFPEAYGGAGQDFLSLTMLLERMGRFLLPGPFFSTVVLAGLPIAEHGTEPQKRQFLPPMADGELLMTLALTEPSARYDPGGIQLQASREGDQYLLNGAKLFVPNANVADHLVVAARTQEGTGSEGITLFIVPSNAHGVSQRLLWTVASDRQSEMTFHNVQAPRDGMLGEVHQGWPILERVLQQAAVAKCAEMVGQAEAMLGMTVSYASQRVQFGHPIGSFQAIQHHCANMAIDLEGARAITSLAAWRLAQGLHAEREVAYAKGWTSDAVRRIAALAHQCHGAIGFTREYDLQLYSRRAKANEVAFGDSDFHRERVALALGI